MANLPNESPASEDPAQIVLVAVGSRFKPLACRMSLPLVIGRGGEIELTVPDPLISRRHCQLSASNGQIVVEDLESLNGTFVGTERVRDAVCPYGELLTIGPLTFRVEPPDADPPGVIWCSQEEFAQRLCDGSSFGMAKPDDSVDERERPPGGDARED